MNYCKGQNPPKKLYRFRPCTGDYFDDELKALLENRAWFQPVNALNDPAECRPDFQVSSFEDFKNEMEQFRARFGKELLWNGMELDKLLEKLTPAEIANYRSLKFQFGQAVSAHDGLLRWLRETFKSISFSKCWRSPLMWGHYADGSRGICIEYERDESVAAEKVFQRSVEYRVEKPILTTVDMLRFDVTSRHSEIEEYARNINGMAIKLIGIKSENWGYEQEWRQYTLLETDGWGKNYQQVLGYRPTRIIFGLDTSKELRKRIRATMFDTLGYVHIKMGQDYALSLRE